MEREEEYFCDIRVAVTRSRGVRCWNSESVASEVAAGPSQQLAVQRITRTFFVNKSRISLLWRGNNNSKFNLHGRSEDWKYENVDRRVFH